jgi:hypothetical protein
MTHRGNAPARAVTRTTSLSFAPSAQPSLTELVDYLSKPVAIRDDGDLYQPVLDCLERELERETARARMRGANRKRARFTEREVARA